MSKGIYSWNDERMRNIMGNLLRVGVFSAAFLVICGGIIFFTQHPKEIADYTSFRGEPARLRQLSLIINGVMHLQGRDIIQLGLILLIATPIARVLFSLIGFLIEKDWVYVVITFIVFSVLMFSIFS